MDISSFLFPKELFALVIWYIQIGFFIFWLFLVVREAFRLTQFKKQIKKLEDVNKLALFLRDPAKPTVSENDAINYFNAFCAVVRKYQSSPIVRHLRAIFQAGFKQSSLDINLLIKSTNNHLLSAHTALRALLSLFIILGLLGTLGGLSLSLNELSVLLTTNSQITNEALSAALKNLLPKLGVAFATSFWGVAFTILGVLIFALYNNLIAAPANRLLESETFMNWVPNLIPTPSQILEEKMILTERQMQKSFDAAQKVAEFADDIKGEAGAFAESFKNASSTLDTLKTASDNLNEFSKTFIESVGKLTYFQEDLKTLTKQMADDSTKFHTTVENVLNGNKEFQRTVQEEFKAQAEQAEKSYSANSSQTASLVGALQSYESAYIKNRESIDANLLLLLQDARDAFHSIKNQNDDVIFGLAQGVGNPLREEIVTSLRNVASEIGGGLASISYQNKEGFANISNNLGEEFGGFSDKLDTALTEVVIELKDAADILKHINIPLKAAAEKIELTFGTFDTNAGIWANEINTTLKTQSGYGEIQTEALWNLNGHLDTLVAQVTEISTTTDEIKKLNSAIITLGDKIEKIKLSGNSRPAKTGSTYSAQPKPTRWGRIKNRLPFYRGKK
jgi:biopolymer transport protein ExbB/TolQ